MAKWRALHKKISTSGQVNRMSEFAQFLFERTMLHADDWGVFTGDPLEVKADAIPLSERTEEEFDAALIEMETVGLIWRYEPKGQGRLIQFINFDEHQPKILIGNRSDPRLPLHYLHPNYAHFPELHWHKLEKAGKPCNSVESVEETSKSKSVSRSSKSKSSGTKRKKPDTPHHRVVAAYVERVSKGYSKRYPGKFKGDLAKIKAMLGRGHSEKDILACYDSFKSEAFWAGKHLSMKHIDEHIDDWKGARRATHKPSDGISDEEWERVYGHLDKE